MVPAIFLPPVAISDLLRGVDDQIRSQFEAFRADCFTWLLVATGIVILGLALEGPELWYEIVSIFRHWRFRHRFRFSLSESHAPNWVTLLAFIGWILIVVGVAGEYVADSFVSAADGYVQSFNDTLLNEARKGTAVARERANAAYERASENERETASTLKQAAQERADAARSLAAAETARKNAEGFQLQISQANERAAKAEEEAAKSNATAEQEKVARLQLMAQLAARTITDDQKRRLRIAFARLKGKTVDVAVIGDTWEVAQFSGSIMQCMTDEGVLLNRTHPLSGGARGVLVGVKDDADAPFKDAASDLIRILQESVGQGVSPWKFDEIDPTKFGAMTTGQDKGSLPLGQSPLRIVIASK